MREVAKAARLRLMWRRSGNLRKGVGERSVYVRAHARVLYARACVCVSSAVSVRKGRAFVTSVHAGHRVVFHTHCLTPHSCTACIPTPTQVLVMSYTVPLLVILYILAASKPHALMHRMRARAHTHTHTHPGAGHVIHHVPHVQKRHLQEGHRHCCV